MKNPAAVALGRKRAAVRRIFRLGARIYDLRHTYGYEIETKQLPDSNGRAR